MREPKWNIFMHDKECALNGKISRAVCPPKVAICNPCLEYIKYVMFPWFGKFEVAQKEQSGVNKSFECMEDLIVDYESGDLDPLNVKLAFEKGICKILEHVGTCLNSNAEAQALIIDLMGHIRRIESVDIHEFHW